MKNICKKITGLILITILITSTNVALAVTQSDINKQQSEQKEIQNQINEVEEKKEEIEAEKSATMKQVESISSQIDGYETQIEELDSQIADANAKIEEAEEKLVQKQEEYDKKQETFKERLVAIYETGETSYLDFLLSSSSLTDFISNYYLVTELSEMDSQLIENLEKEKEEIENSKKTIEESKQQLTTAKASKESVNSELKTAKAEKDKYIAELSDQEAELQKQIDELKSHEKSVSSKIQQMKQQYDAEQASKNTSTGTSGSMSGGASSSYGFGWPVANHTIGTRYGVAGSYWSSGYHTGVDFPVSTGTTVYAVGDGQVFDTGYNRAYGYFVEIYHGNNVYSFYAHASSVQVSVGQRVSKGQAIMLSGATGNVSGPHLHFEIRTPGYGYSSCVNPMPYLP